MLAKDEEIKGGIMIIIEMLRSATTREEVRLRYAAIVYHTRAVHKAV